jgi:hypothetical protein
MFLINYIEMFICKFLLNLHDTFILNYKKKKKKDTSIVDRACQISKDTREINVKMQ